MASVEKCPETLTAVNASSKQLNCGIDTYGNNQYMCLPNMEKSSLVEFCYDGIMGIQKEGNCLEAKDGRVILQSCDMFLSGCPKKPFFNYEFYKYPACQDINSKHFCYTLDPSCQALVNDPFKPGDSSTDDHVVMYSLIGGLLVLVILAIVIASILNLNRWKRWENDLNQLKADRKPDKPGETSDQDDEPHPHFRSYIERVNNSSKMDLGDVTGVLSKEEEDYLDLLLNDEVCEDLDDNDENVNPSNC